jgi:hypothetical protein
VRDVIGGVEDRLNASGGANPPQDWQHKTTTKARRDFSKAYSRYIDKIKALGRRGDSTTEAGPPK